MSDAQVREGDRRALVRRATWLLAIAVAFIQFTFPVFLLVAGPAAEQITGTATSIGVVSGLYFVAAAGGAFAIGRSMDRTGRRRGLLLSITLLVVGGVGSAWAVGRGSYPLLLLFAVPFGVANGGANLARGAIADMYLPAERGRAVGLVLAAGTAGAVLSSFLVGFLQDDVAPRLGANPDVVPWILVPLGAVVAGVLVTAVRPDPRDLAPVAPTPAGDAPVPAPAGDGAPTGHAPARSPRELWAVPAFRLAVLAAAVGQMVMVGIMTVTPTSLHDHGHGGQVRSIIISLHITGMFAFAPLIGAGMDRYGRRSGLVAGFVVSIVGALAAATESPAQGVGIGLFLIGLGWSATYLGSTAVVSDMTAPSERAGALGTMDLVVSLTSAVAALLGGVVLGAASYRVLSVAMAVLVLGVVLPVARLREQLPAAARS